MKRMLPVLAGIFALSSFLNAETIGAKDSKKAPAQSVYKAVKTDERIIVDGKLDEDIWSRAPSMKFVDIEKGTDAFYKTEGKIVWDDNYLYAGYYFEEPDVRAYWGLEDARLPEDFRILKQKSDWGRNECLIMRADRFAKLFLDPDGDGSSYLEFQINPLNRIFDSWYKQGFTENKSGERNRFPHVAWKCPGLLSAAHIYGSVNNPSDIDKGWSLEIAIPWSALKPFIRGNCPPRDGDLWGAHLGRVFREAEGESNVYWVWPFLEYKNCHLPDRYGKLVFEDKVPKFDRFFGWGLRQTPDFIRKAADSGVTDIIAGGGPVKEEILAECKKHGINIYKTVTIIANQAQWAKKYPDTPMPLQELSTEEKTTLDALKGNSYQEDSGPEYNDSAPPENWQVTEAQKKLIEKAGRENIKAQKDYHWGGEPGKKYLSQWGRNQELLFTDLFCFHHPEVKEFIKSLIAKEMEEQGIKGIAFDFFGYTNYKCCRCAESMRLFNEFREKNNLKPDDTAMNKFSLDTLVEFQNEMADYVKSIRPDAVTLDHVYPVFLPEPLYGNRLKLDYCGQTASWYFYWDPFKIYNYSKVITEEQGKYFPNAKGVTFIGYYSRLDFPYKSPERVELELRSMLKAGSSMVMVCGLCDVLDSPETALVFKKLMKNRK